MEGLWVILGLTAFSIILGILWYGPLFGKKFSWANDWPDFNLLGWFVETLGSANAVETALWLWFGFILPIMAGNAVWNMQPNKKKLTILFIGLSYQLVLMAVAGYVFSLM